MQFIGYSDRPGKNCFEFANLNKGGMPQQVTVHFNQLFNYPPTLTLVGQGLTSTEGKRGAGYDWIYTIYSYQVLGLSSATAPPLTDEQDYKLEILF